MAACMTTGNTNCCTAAAACSSARICPLLDTAIIAVVSICILCLRLRGLIA